MALDLNKIVIWSRSYDEYIRFFKLTDFDLKKKILSCADGAASFNLEAREKGYEIISADPIYFHSPEHIQELIQNSHDYIFPLIKQNAGDNNWNYFKSPEHQRDHRMATMQRFLEDFKKVENRSKYIPGALPELPFCEDSFEIGLVSHFLFLYSSLLSFDFHIQSLENLCKICQEVRVFPLHCNTGGISPYLELAMSHLHKLGYSINIEKVDHEITKGSDKMLRITR